MTVQEIYDWAKEHNCLNVPIAKHTNMDIVDVNVIIHLEEEIPNLCNGYSDRVILD